MRRALKSTRSPYPTLFRSFGEVGDPFDPTIHEAVLHDVSDEVSEPTCTTVMRPGYKHNDRLLRPAMVGVSDRSEEHTSELQSQFQLVCRRLLEKTKRAQGQ